MDGTNFPEGGEPQETFYKMTHLAPLEHILIGSSVKIPGKNPGEEIIVNSNTVANDAYIRNNPDLLKPIDFINGKLNQEQIRSGRESKKVISGIFPCFKVVREILRKDYAIDYKLANPDENGRIPNNFIFQFRPEDGVYNSADAYLLGVFDQIELSERKKALFSMSKDRETGTISLVFMPLVDQAVK